MKTTNDKDKILLDSISDFLEKLNLRYAFKPSDEECYNALQKFKEDGLFKIKGTQRNIKEPSPFVFEIKRLEESFHVIVFYTEETFLFLPWAFLRIWDYSQKDLYNFVLLIEKLVQEMFMLTWDNRAGDKEADFCHVFEFTKPIQIEALPRAILHLQNNLNRYAPIIEQEREENKKEQARVKAKRFVKDVGTIAKNYGLPVFVVTDGASLTDNNGCEAVEHARAAHKDWELKNNITDDGGEK